MYFVYGVCEKLPEGCALMIRQKVAIIFSLSNAYWQFKKILPICINCSVIKKEGVFALAYTKDGREHEERPQKTLPDHLKYYHLFSR